MTEFGLPEHTAGPGPWRQWTHRSRRSRLETCRSTAASGERLSMTEPSTSLPNLESSDA